MSKGLYIFVTSERPDAYLNSILHCFKYERIDKVTLIYIKSPDESGSSKVNPQQTNIANNVLKSILILVSSLATDGVYRYSESDNNHQAGETAPLEKVYSKTDLDDLKNIYSDLLGKASSISEFDVAYLQLKEKLADIHKKEPESIFDVTAIKKVYLGDIFAISVIEGLHDIYTFNLEIKPDYETPWKVLFHELDKEKKKKYQYVNIVDTFIFKQCTSSILARSIPLRLSLIAAPTLVLIFLFISFYLGSTNWILQALGIISAVASLLSIFFTLFPPRKL